MAWYVLTENEVETIRNRNSEGEALADRIEEKGQWTENDTLLVNPRGMDHMSLTGSFGIYPRRFGIDPPTNTEPLEID